MFIRALALVLGVMAMTSTSVVHAASCDAQSDSTTVLSYEVSSGDTLYHIAKLYGDDVAALKDRNGLTDEIIVPGQQLTVRAHETRTATVSWYGPKFHGQLMANGKRFDMEDASVVAHKSLPMDTLVAFENPQTGDTLIARVQDRGPYVGDRAFDFSRAAAKQLGFKEHGVTTLRYRVLCK
jgi:rare lipoprotein A